MDYQVWTKAEYGTEWSREECGDIEAAKRIILSARQQGKEVTLTVEVPFELLITVGDPGGEPKTPKETKRKTHKDQIEEAIKSEAD